MLAVGSVPSRARFAALLSIAATLAIAFFSGSAAATNEPEDNIRGDNGPSKFYSHGGECDNGETTGGATDPVGVIFEGKRSGPSNVSAYVGDKTGWKNTATGIHQDIHIPYPVPNGDDVHVDISDKSGLRVRQTDGTFRCRANDAANAEGSQPLRSRFHIRLWYVPGSAGGDNTQQKTVGTPHHEDWKWEFLNPDCDLTDVIAVGNHAVDEGGVSDHHPNAQYNGYKNSGFDRARHVLREHFEDGGFKNITAEQWGNTNEHHQCDGGWAGSDGNGIVIPIKRALHPYANRAYSVTTSSATLPGTLTTEEPAEYWFAYGLKSSAGSSGYPYSTGVKSTSGPVEVNFSQNITGLAPGTRYYVRLFARNQAGEMDESPEVQFKTCAPLNEDDDQSPGPRTIAQCNGTVDVFYRTSEGKLGHNWFDVGGLGWQTGDLPASIAANAVPHAIGQSNGTIDVFYRTATGGLGHNWFDTGGAGWLSGNLPGSVASDPHAVVQGNGTIDVFYRTATGGLGHNWFDTGGAGWLSGNLPGSVASDPHAVVQANGTVDVFYRTPNNELGHNWFDTGGSGWHVGNLPGSVGSDPHAVVQPNGTIDVFYRTTTGGLGHNWFDTGGSGWHVGNLPGSVASEPHPVVQANGTVDVFYRTTSGGLGHNWFDTGGLGWQSGNLPGTLASDPHAVVQGNGTVDVFYRTPSGGLGHNWFDTGGAGWLSGDLPATMASDPRAVVQSNGTLDVFYRTTAGALGHNWFDTGGAGWQSGDLPASIAARPPVATAAASYVAATRAKLEGTVNPEGSPTAYYFEYGPTTAYGAKAPASPAGLGYGTTAVSVSQFVSGLAANTTYHYRIVAESPEGVSNGTDKTFTTGSQEFAGLKSWGSWSTSYSATLADANGDGKDDLLGRNSSGGDRRVGLSTGTTFGTAASWGTWSTDNSFDWQLADVNGDGKADTVGRNNANGEVRVGLSTGSGFNASVPWTTWSTSYSLNFADVNGDGRDDIVGRNSSGGDRRVGLSTGTAFAAATSWGAWSTDNSLTWQLADVNGDGKADSVGRNEANGEVRVGLSTGSTFSASAPWTTWSTVYSLTFADVNGDGREDLVGRSSGGDIQVGLSTGSAFASSRSWGYLDPSYTRVMGDVNGDNRADVVGWNSSTGAVQVGLSTGPATPIASYSFNEGSGLTLHDSSGKHEGTIAGGATWTTGKYGAALHFDGVDDLVTIPAAADLNLGNNFTLEAWVRPDEIRPWADVLSKDAPGGYELLSEGGYEAPRAAVARSATGNYVVNATSANRLPVLTWSHLVLTSDGAYLRLYLNGIQIGSVASGSVYSIEGVTKIGDYFKGSIDEIRIYDRTLSATEINEDKGAAVG